MFAEIGVMIEWHPYESCPAAQDRLILIELIDQSPKEFPSGVMATAKPYAHEGVTIQLFRDHMNLAQPRMAAPFLAHVLAHEITHILQGVVRHSESGIMKAHWSNDDYGAMAWKPLSFSPEDVRLIHPRVSREVPRSALKTDDSTSVEMSNKNTHQ